MATVIGMTAERALQIDAALIVSGTVNGQGQLILVKKDGSQINAGTVIGSFPTEDQNDARYVARVIHNGSTYPARPDVPAGMAEYVGPTTPTTWQTGDTWVQRT